MFSPKCKEVEGEIKSLIKVWFLVIASLSYCYFISSKIPKGKLRFLSIIPVLYLYTILPLQLSTLIPKAIIASFITWLTTFKLLLFTFDLGPLSSNPLKSLPFFISFACLPIKGIHPSNQNHQRPSREKLHLILFPIKAIVFGVLMLMLGLSDYKRKMHPTIVVGLDCTIAYLTVDVVLGLFNILVNALLGIELELPSDEPYLSTSLHDFWGRRWNLIVTNLLRHTVHIPVRTALSKTILGPQWAWAPGVLASFLVSGLMHELLLYYITLASPTWEVTCFFVLHGVCVDVEYLVMKWLSNKRRLHWAVAGPITVAFVVATAEWLLFLPFSRAGAHERSTNEFRNLIDCIRGIF